MIASRTTLTTRDGVSHLHLDVLSEEEALALLARAASRARVDREPAAATTPVSLCARLPLAVRIAAARLAARTFRMLGVLDWSDMSVPTAAALLDQARTYWQHAVTILQDIGGITAEEANTLRGRPIPDTPEIIHRNT